MGCSPISVPGSHDYWIAQSEAVGPGAGRSGSLSSGLGVDSGNETKLQKEAIRVQDPPQVSQEAGNYVSHYIRRRLVDTAFGIM
jgi:hypothetical protein